MGGLNINIGKIIFIVIFFKNGAKAQKSMIHLTAEEIHLEGNTEIFVIRNVLTVIEEATMLVIVGREENQDPQEAIVRIATQKDIKTKVEDIDLLKGIEMIIEEEIEEVQMIGMLREAEELRGVIQETEIEVETIIELVQEIIEEVAMIMIEEDPKDIMTQDIRVNKNQVDQDLTVKIEKKDTMKILKKVIEGIKEKGIITIETEIKDQKMKKMNTILETRAKGLKTFLNKKTTK